MADPIIGYADLHCHPMAHLGFGGRIGDRALFWGEPTGPLDQALPCCRSAHEFLQGGLVPIFTEPEKKYRGHPDYLDWPRHNTIIHQQMYVDAVKRAFHGGLRLMVASAVNNELLADIYHGRQLPQAFDEHAIRAQLDGMKTFAAANKSWMEVVRTPGEARAAILAGRLAVVLAIEVDSIVGGSMRHDGDLDPTAAAATVQKWWDEGARLINPIHLVDNALGGTAIFDDRFNLANHYLHAKWGAPRPAEFFKVEGVGPGSADADVRYLLGVDPASSLLITVYGKGYPPYAEDHGATGHVNERGLSAAGAAFLEAMMNLGMLIDVEHMSSKALDGTLKLAEARRYPLVSSHTGLRTLAVPRTPQDPFVKGCASEGMRTDAQLRRLASVGGVIGIGGHVGRIRNLDLDCSRSWAWSYRHLRDVIGVDAIAIGTDMNGFAQAPGPRFRYDSAGRLVPIVDLPNVEQLPLNQWAERNRPIAYDKDFIPFVGKVLERSALGARRKFDFNTDGFAHYGMLPDFTLDVALSMGGQESLRAFYHSAEAFIEAWERCVS